MLGVGQPCTFSFIGVTDCARVLKEDMRNEAEKINYEEGSW